MSNLVQFTPQYYPRPDIGRPIPSGSKIYVGEPDTDPTVLANQKQVSVLQEDTTLVTVSQPILTGAGGQPIHNGTTVSLFVEGDYSSRVDDPNDAQIYYIPRTQSQEATGTQFPTWEVGTTYAQNAYVTGSDNRLYYSIAGANLGNDPTSTSGFWQGFVQEGDTFTGDTVGTHTGPVVGDVTGDVSGLASGSLIDVQEFFNSGTWTRPTGCKRVEVVCVGGGGGGGGTTAAAPAAGGGGAGGTASFRIIELPSATESVVVGAGGAGASGVDGVDGGDSSFGSITSGHGGHGGVVGNGSIIANTNVDGIGGYKDPSGGNQWPIYGQDGENGHVLSAVGIIAVGAGGQSIYGLSGESVAPGEASKFFQISTNISTNGVGRDGTLFGMGGGGASNTTSAAAAPGGDGSKGIVIVRSYA